MSHLLVVAMVTFASAFGIAQARNEPASGDQAGFFTFISPARGAASESTEPLSMTLSLQPESGGGLADEELLSRGVAARAPTREALPTPVPVDPDATPLPGPVAATILGQGSVRSGSVPTAVAPSGGPLQWPVPGGYISQYYHAGHLALDVAASYGSSVVAAEAGVVTWAGWRNNGGGNVIEIDHGNGMRTVYNHLGGFWVGAGAAVARGQGIASVGCTGMCTGAHVHFEVIVNGASQNPLRYLN